MSASASRATPPPTKAETMQRTVILTGTEYIGGLSPSTQSESIEWYR